MLYEEGLAIHRELGDRHGIAWSLINMGEAVYCQGDLAAAPTLYEEGLAIYRELEDKHGIAWSLAIMGTVAYERGVYTAARPLYEESLALRRKSGNKRGIAFSLEAFAALDFVQGQTVRALRLWGAAEALREKVGAPLPPPARNRYDRLVEHARTAVSEDSFAAAWARGRAMTMEQAIDYALENLSG